MVIAVYLATNPCPVLKEVTFGTKDYGGHIFPKRPRALTVKKIEVEPYKWLEELDKTTHQNGEIFSLRALTKNCPLNRGRKNNLTLYIGPGKSTRKSENTAYFLPTFGASKENASIFFDYCPSRVSNRWFSPTPTTQIKNKPERASFLSVFTRHG